MNKINKIFFANITFFVFNDLVRFFMNFFLFLKIMKILHNRPYKAPISKALIKKLPRKKFFDKKSIPIIAPKPIIILLSPPPHWPVQNIIHAKEKKIANPAILARMKSILNNIIENRRFIPKPVPIIPILTQSGTSLVLISV